MEVRISHRGGVEFAAEARGKTVLSSATKGVGGLDDALMPTELLLAALGSCAGYYAAQYLRKNNLPMDGLGVRVRADVLKEPSRLGNFRIFVAVPGVDESHRDALTAEVLHCTVHNTLMHPPEMSIELTFASPAPNAQS